MAIKTAKDKLAGHSAVNNKEDVKPTPVESVKINDCDSVMIYNNQVIFTEDNPDTSPFFSQDS